MGKLGCQSWLARGARRKVSSWLPAAGPRMCGHGRKREPSCRTDGCDKSGRGHGDRSAAARRDYLSRPRDHVRDGIEAFSLGLHALVEKPLSVDSESGRPLVAAAERANRVLAVGTEFAFLPAFHQLAEEFATARRIDLSLVWDDVKGEERYGATKVRHEETDLLCDLLPHAFRSCRFFVPNVALRISVAHRAANGCQGRLEFRGRSGGQHELRCDSRAKVRRRIPDARTASARASVDFSGPHSVMTIDGQSRALHHPLSAMTSTLRLELGAFLSQATGATNAAFTSWDASALLSVQADLERALASGAS